MEIDGREIGQQQKKRKCAELPEKLQLEVLKSLHLPKTRELLSINSAAHKNFGPNVAENWNNWEVFHRNYEIYFYLNLRANL